MAGNDNDGEHWIKARDAAIQPDQLVVNGLQMGDTHPASAERLAELTAQHPAKKKKKPPASDTPDPNKEIAEAARLETVGNALLKGFADARAAASPVPREPTLAERIAANQATLAANPRLRTPKGGKGWVDATSQETAPIDRPADAVDSPEGMNNIRQWVAAADAREAARTKSKPARSK